MLERAYCSDASTEGYALHVTTADKHQLWDVAVWRERWRFIDEDPGPDASGAELRGGLAGDAGQAGDFSAWVDRELQPPDDSTAILRSGDERQHPRERPQVERVGLVPRVPDAFANPARWQRRV
eukprot:2372743-Pyramimonas_sp.AAC.1